MAKATEEGGGAGGLEAELSCPICLCLFREPVSLSCGHNFCRQCIQKVLGAQQRARAPYACPVCELQLGPILELQKNFQLCNIVQSFQASTPKAQQGEGSEQGEAEVVPCDYCLDGAQAAVKTCLVCEASLCQAHLGKHSARAFQQEHILVEVGAGAGVEERTCPEHGRLLECYCQREGKCICPLCYIAGGHKGHKVVTVKEGHDQQLVKLSTIMARLQDDKSNLVTTLEKLQASENQVKTNMKSVTSQLQKLFESTKTQLIQKEKKILSDIQSSEEKQLAAIAEVRKEMEEMREHAEQNLQSLQKIKEQQDTFLFFKEFKLIKDRIASQDWGTERADVVEVQVDHSRIARFQRLREDLMWQLDSLLHDVHNELTNQLSWIWSPASVATAIFSKSEEQQEGSEQYGYRQNVWFS